MYQTPALNVCSVFRATPVEATTLPPSKATLMIGVVPSAPSTIGRSSCPAMVMTFTLASTTMRPAAGANVTVALALPVAAARETPRLLLATKGTSATAEFAPCKSQGAPSLPPVATELNGSLTRKAPMILVLPVALASAHDPPDRGRLEWLAPLAPPEKSIAETPPKPGKKTKRLTKFLKNLK